MAANLIGDPSRQKAVEKAGGLAVEAGVLLEPLAQAHHLWHGDDNMAIADARKPLQQAMADVF